MNIQPQLALFIFIGAYLAFVIFPARRTGIALTGAILILLTGVLSPMEGIKAINWNVMGIFVGMLAVAEVFMASRVPAYFAEILIDRAPNTAWALIFLCAMSSFISMFVENVATVLIVAPIALSLTKKLKIDPTATLIAIAVCSNLQGTATLIGDPPSMLLAGFAKMNFGDFFFYHGRPSIFFAVQLGALASLTFLYWLFRPQTTKQELVSVEQVKSWIPTFLLIGLIIALAVSSFFDTGFSYQAGLLCMIAGIISLLWDKLANRKPLWPTVKSLDWDTTFFLMGIFIIVGSISETGWIQVFADFLARLVKDNVLTGYLLLVLLSVALSAFVDNVPFLAAMLPVAITMAAKLGIPAPLLLFGLLIGASLGGNITPIGASANIVCCGLLKKEGYPVRFGQFVRIGLPFTFWAVLPAAVFIWYIWSK